MDYSCYKCKCKVEEGSSVVFADTKSYHAGCFICAYCFKPFSESQYYSINDQLLCYEDYKNLYAPICSECEIGIIGKVIKAVNLNWHVDCFKCYYCKKKLQSSSGCNFYHKKICCSECSKTRSAETYICTNCKERIMPNKSIFYKHAPVHPWHYLCSVCGNELTEESKESNGVLYCLKCFDHSYATVCEICKTVISEERSIFACNHNYHHQHFCCTKCGVTLHGVSYYQHNNLPYCETHFREFFGKVCCICKFGIAEGESVLFGRIHCEKHAVCYICLKNSEEASFTGLDGKPICKKCYSLLPTKVKKSTKDDK